MEITYNYMKLGNCHEFAIFGNEVFFYQQSEFGISPGSSTGHTTQ